MLNGNDLRVVLWLSGCTHACAGCQNPITWDMNGGLIFDEIAKAELFKELTKDYIAGVTFSGGDPLHPANREDLELLIQEIRTKFPSKNIWLYTGFTWNEIKGLSFVPYIDVIVDGKFKIDLLDKQLHWKGSSNQNVIDVKNSLAKNELVLWES